jgi:hypothetical protein
MFSGWRMGGPAKRANGVDQVSETLKKPVDDAGRKGRLTQPDLTEFQAKLLLALNRDAEDLMLARHNAARELGMYKIWEHFGEQ